VVFCMDINHKHVRILPETFYTLIIRNSETVKGLRLISDNPKV
jgi:hypothetical protein